jgi:hypothetical protein
MANRLKQLDHDQGEAGQKPILLIVFRNAPEEAMRHSVVIVTTLAALPAPDHWIHQGRG